MTVPQTKLDELFLSRQLERLQLLRAKLVAAAKGRSDEEAGLAANAVGEAREYEDDAQKLAMLELESNLLADIQQRLIIVDRARQKIEEGSYGLSDASGEMIPRERLEAMPEAIYTLAEQRSRER
jgi:RNA polymerase-binding transcription factor